jgi:hypothetical protein
MAYGVPPKSTHTLPPGRKAFVDSTHTIVSGSKTDVVRPGKWSDGQDRMGTPAGAEHTGAGKQRYADGVKYRAGLRGVERPQSNDRVSSKGARNARRDGFTPTDPRQPSQPGTLERRDLPPSLPPETRTDRVPLGGVSRRVGFVGDGKPFVGASHAATTRRHGSDGVHDPRTITDGVQGQAWSASGGEHGKQSPRRGASAPSGTRTQDAGALERASYVPTRKRK